MSISLPYLGGLFDGEGSAILTLTLSRCRPKYYVAVSMGNTCKAVLDLMQLAIGEGTIQERPGQNYKMWHWYTSHSSAVRAAKLLIPHTVIKRRELELLVEYAEEADPLGKQARSAGRYAPDMFDGIVQRRFDLYNRYRTKIKEARDSVRQPI